MKAPKKSAVSTRPARKGTLRSLTTADLARVCGGSDELTAPPDDESAGSIVVRIPITIKHGV